MRHLFSCLAMFLMFKLFKSFPGLIQEIRLLFGIRPLEKEDVAVLERFFPYFQNLNAKHKDEFKDRLAYFIASKKFIPRGELREISREMKLLVGATAVMVTFGFRNLKLKNFSKILLYPDNYYSTINKTYHQGEVNPRLGIIVISWKSFVEGFLVPNNGINLGIHEMAHALKLENQIQNEESNFFNAGAWQQYEKLAKNEILKIKRNEDSIFRPSASKNIHEFFAVSLESFFEIPQQFKAYHPELYKSLVYLLQQDPLVLAK